MATMEQLQTRVMNRFRSVQSVTIEDVNVWLMEALALHGYEHAEEVKDADILQMIVIRAQYEGSIDIAMRTAHFFSYTDADEVVDKSMIAKEWRQIAAILEKEYEKARSRSSLAAEKSRYRTMMRLDRM